MIRQHTTAGQPQRRASRLVIASHAGDEVLGCGGMLAKYRDDSAVVILADPDEIHAGQIETAQWMLGDPEVTLLGLQIGHLADDVDRIVGALADVVAQVRPAEVYLPYPLLHHDHLVTFEAGMRSTRMSSPREDWPQVSVLAYHVGAVGPQDYPADVQWNVCEPLGEEDVDCKVAAAIAYRSPLAKVLKSRAEEIGSVRRTAWAEQFALVRSARGVSHRHEVPSATAQDLAGVVR